MMDVTDVREKALGLAVSTYAAAASADHVSMVFAGPEFAENFILGLAKKFEAFINGDTDANFSASDETHIDP